MVNLCDDYEGSNLEEPKNDVIDQRNVYQLHHQLIFSDNKDCEEDKVCTTSSDIGHINLRKPSKEGIDKITT